MLTAFVGATIDLTREVGATEGCATPEVACGAGFVCNNGDPPNATCEPVDPMRVCTVSERVGTWAPPGAGTFTLRGVVLNAPGSTQRDVSRVSHGADTEFIAPRTGRYRFSTEGATSLEVRAVCDSPTCQRVMGPLAAEVELTAGQHIPINAAVTNGQRNAPFSVSVIVP